MPVRATASPEASDIANSLRHLADEVERSRGISQFYFEVATMFDPYRTFLEREATIRFTFKPDIVTVNDPRETVVRAELTNGDLRTE